MRLENADELGRARVAFRDALYRNGYLVPGATDGILARTGRFEAVVEAVDRHIGRAGAALGAEVLRFPPVVARETFEKTNYIASFPHLTGAVTTFAGTDRDHAALLAARNAGEDWLGHLHPAGTMLVPAACHPAYPLLAGTLPEGGRVLDIYGYCFRHEPSPDPARMQAFRMREYVHAGTPESASAHQADWVAGALGALEDLGLPAAPAAANDPFFGRAGRMLAANQVSANLKVELVVPLYGDLDEGTAVASANYHRDHFGEAFGIRSAGGATAHTACAGFGMERIVLALLRTHGFDTGRWPAPVRRALGS